MRILSTQSIYYDDVNLIAQPNAKLTSRKEVPQELWRIFVSPMPAVVGAKFATEAINLGLSVCLHRFCSLEDNVKIFYSVKDAVGWPCNINKLWCSIGLNDIERLDWLVTAGCKNFVIDVANGYLDSVAKYTKEVHNWIKTNDPSNNTYRIMVGNIHSSAGIQLYTQFPYIHVRCGIGNGCFAGDTRVLMADGSYKNIKDLKVHDKIIDGGGEQTEVLAVKFSGFKRVLKYRHNRFYKETVCTLDHLHYIHDFNDFEKERYLNCGWAKTSERKQNYKWKEINELDQDVLLIPSKIKFDVKSSFEYNIEAKFKRTEKSKNITTKIVSDYKLGYLIGVFLGDGNAAIRTNERKAKGKPNTTNTVTECGFSFGLDETEIAHKAQKYIKDIFNIDSLINYPKDRNILQLRVDSAPIARFFIKFYDSDKNKFLPKEFICSHEQYNMGLIDGLIDSDGTIEIGKLSFFNTSEQLMEIFGLACYFAKGFWPSFGMRQPTTGTLKNINIENCKPCFSSNFGPKYSKYVNNKYQINQLLRKTEELIQIPTYDIEVSSKDNSFIANNCIVHNSQCETSSKATGYGRGQITELSECADFITFQSETNTPPILCADGGIANGACAAKAFACGADEIMMGSYFGLAEEAQNVIDGEYKMWGCASTFNQAKFGDVRRHSEGRVTELDKNKIKPLKVLVDELWGGISSAVSYGGFSTMNGLIGNGIFEIKK